MSAPTSNNFEALGLLFRRHIRLLVLPIVAFVAFAFIYIYSTKPTWRATQSIQIRDEFAKSHVVPGRFDSLHMMKMVQETIYDTARRQSVVKNVLLELGPPDNYKNPSEWPTLEDIETIQSSISLSPPNGAEFGQTEVLMLSVDASSVERAKKIVAALANELKIKLNEIRDLRSSEVEQELRQSVRFAREELKTAQDELSQFEQKVGEILIDLRAISGIQPSGSTSLQNRMQILGSELRVAKQAHVTLTKQLEKVRSAAEDPKEVLSFSGELLAAQPSLQKLKDELIATQSRAAATLGQFDEIHPKAKAAIRAEETLHERVREEIHTAVAGIELQVDVIDSQIKSLVNSRAEIQTKFENLAHVRVPYATLSSNVSQRRRVLDDALDELTRAISSRKASETSSLITLIDKPYSGSRPEGLPKRLVLATAGIAGLLSGIGLVFFAASPSFVGNLDHVVDEVNRNPHAQPDWRKEILELSNDQSELVEPIIPIQNERPHKADLPESTTKNPPTGFANDSTPASSKEKKSGPEPALSPKATVSTEKREESGKTTSDHTQPDQNRQPRFGYSATVGMACSVAEDLESETGESESELVDEIPSIAETEGTDKTSLVESARPNQIVQHQSDARKSTSGDSDGNDPDQSIEISDRATSEEKQKVPDKSARNTSSSAEVMAKLQEEHKRRIQELLKRNENK